MDYPQYDMTAVFEAVVNAVAHRDYSAYGSKIRLQMFADRIDLYSPGGPGGIADRRNARLPPGDPQRNDRSPLTRCAVPCIAGLDTHSDRLMDRRGEGVAAILDRSAEISGREPEYRCSATPSFS